MLIFGQVDDFNLVEYLLVDFYDLFFSVKICTMRSLINSSFPRYQRESWWEGFNV